jgi:hypothetical protein
MYLAREPFTQRRTVWYSGSPRIDCSLDGVEAQRAVSELANGSEFGSVGEIVSHVGSREEYYGRESKKSEPSRRRDGIRYCSFDWKCRAPIRIIAGARNNREQINP